MTPFQIIVLATPVFFALMALEFGVGRARGRAGYRLHDMLTSVGLGMLSQLVGLFTRLLNIGLYTLVFEHLAWFEWRVGSPWTWVGALLLYDLCYYWLHRAGHRVGLLWAAHAVHHQSEDYNLSTALRQTGSGWIASWLFYLPMAVLGVPPLVFATVALVDLLYQFWVHTEQIGSLGWFDRWFCSPANHRVNHAVNDRYVDKNYGGILILWDRLFGSFEAEDKAEPPVYGTRTPLRSFNPLWANLVVYADLARDAWRTRRWPDKLKVWWAPPGWRPADVAALDPKPAFELAAVRRFDPPMRRWQQGLATFLFGLALAGTSSLLWQAHRLEPAWLALGSAAVAGALVAMGALCQGRPAAAE